MSRVLGIALIVALASGTVRIARSGEPVSDPPRNVPHASLVCPDVLLRACCDDYCPKRPPCIPCYNRCCGCDDYCGKRSPCIPCYQGGSCDCYCPKPCPELCRPLIADYFTCSNGPTACDPPAALEAAPAAPITAESHAEPRP